MKSRQEVFEAEAKKINSQFNVLQFRENNKELYRIIDNSILAYSEEVRKEMNRLKKLVDDDTDYKAMRTYAKELEARLGIYPDSGK